MDYSNYEVQDFASDDSFIEWVIEDSPESHRFWEDYKISHPDQKDTIEQARQLVINLRKAEQTLHTPARLTKIWNHIEAGISPNSHSKSISEDKGWLVSAKPFFTFWRVAASISILALGISAWHFVDHDNVVNLLHEATAIPKEEDGFIEEVNTTGNVIRIHLSDGSTVELHDNSRLRYRKDHLGHPFREVFLTGEAFFRVAKNPKQPFLVYADKVVTRVLGTSFCVRAFDDDRDIVVAVKEGKVSVYTSRENGADSDPIVSEVNGVVLLPNQQVIYGRNDDSFVKTLIADPQIIEDEQSASLFVFENAPVTEVFNLFQQAYGIEIIADEEVMRNCFITVRLHGEPLFEKLKIVCRTIGARYELIDGKIIISANGC